MKSKKCGGGSRVRVEILEVLVDKDVISGGVKLEGCTIGQLLTVFYERGGKRTASIWACEQVQATSLRVNRLLQYQRESTEFWNPGFVLSSKHPKACEVIMFHCEGRVTVHSRFVISMEFKHISIRRTIHFILCKLKREKKCLKGRLTCKPAFRDRLRALIR